MADNIGITRVPTNEEKQDYNQLGTYTPKQQFLIELSNVEAKYTKNHEPFDSQCAKLDFSDKIDDLEKESERKFGYVRDVDLKNLKFGDFEKYGKSDRFTIERDDEEIEMQNVNNTRTSVLIGHTVRYVCKERGHGCSVFIPLELYNERFGNKKEVVVNNKEVVVNVGEEK